MATDHAMEAMPQVTFAYTAYGRSLADAGRLEEAAAALEDGLTSRRQMPGLSPWPLIHHLLQMASVAARSHNPTVAERMLVEVEALTPWTDDTMDATRARIEAVRRQIAPHVPPTPVAGDPLTPREEQLLRRLAGTQTLREIANDLFVSINTVKTITQSVYRKLGVHSRAEAVATAAQRRQTLDTTAARLGSDQGNGASVHSQPMIERTFMAGD
jgi:LuxR family maltose regulon positive regulatory protein